MSKILKLSPKQLAAIQSTEQQKQQLNTMLQEVIQKQALIAELAFEGAGIDLANVDNIKLEGDGLTYEDKTAVKVKAKAKAEKKKEVTT